MASGPPATRAPRDEPVSRDSDVCRLLRGYDGVLGAAGREPSVTWVRTRPPGHCAFTRFCRLPRPTWLLGFFVAWHLDRTTRSLHGMLSRRVATGAASSQDVADREALEIFRSGLPPVRGKTLLAVLIIATVTIGRVALDHAGTVLSAVPVLKDVREYQLYDDQAPERLPPGPAVTVRDDAADLIDDIGEAIGPDVSSLGKTLDALTGAGSSTSSSSSLGPCSRFTSLLARSCRRSGSNDSCLTSLAPGGAPIHHRSLARAAIGRCVRAGTSGLLTPQRGHAARTTRRPWIPALFWASLPVALGAYLIVTAERTFSPYWTYFSESEYLVISGVPFSLRGFPFDYPLEIASLLLVLAALRLAWLGRAWRRRQQPADLVAPHTPYTVRLADGGQLTVRDPWMTGALSYLVPYYLPVWWYLANRQLYRLRQAGSPANLYPIASLLAFSELARGLVLPPLISLWRGRGRLHAAQRAAGLTTHSWRETARICVILLLAGALILQLPLSNIRALAGPFATTLGLFGRAGTIDFEVWWAPVGIVASTSVLAFIAGYFQSRLNVCLATSDVVPEGPGARCLSGRSGAKSVQSTKDSANKLCRFSSIALVRSDGPAQAQASKQRRAIGFETSSSAVVAGEEALDLVIV